MRFCKYNSYITIGTRQIVYNALDDKFVVITDSKNFVGPSTDIVHLQTISPAIYRNLYHAGAIVDDSVDEVDILAKAIDKVDNDSSFCQIHINPTVDCTFRCWYCYEDHKKGTRMQPQTIDAVKNLITRKSGEDIKHLHLSFFGGEPLMYFNSIAKPIIEHANSVCQSANKVLTIHFTTNAFLFNDAIIDFLSEYGTGFQITLDGSQQVHDKVRCTPSGAGSYRIILNNVAELLEHKCPITLRINYTSENINSVSEVIEDLKLLNLTNKHLLSVDFQRVWQDRCHECTDKDSIDQTILRYRDALKALDIVSKKYAGTYLLKESCYGDKRHNVLVNYDGNIFQCTARDFKPQSRSGYLADDGTIVWENDALNRRMSCKFVREVCHNCRIAPLCGGGCRQQALECTHCGCIYDYSERQKDGLVLDRLEYLFL